MSLQRDLEQSLSIARVAAALYEGRVLYYHLEGLPAWSALGGEARRYWLHEAQQFLEQVRPARRMVITGLQGPVIGAIQPEGSS